MPPPDLEMTPGDRADMETLNEIAYAKVNLALHVRQRRADGYHALESLFVFARDGDVLTGRATRDGEIKLRVDGPFGAALDSGPDNLVTRAARALQHHLGESRGAAIALAKYLPVASGIGGGSADAAATLRLLLRLWNAQVSMAELERIALSIGSDVPACLTSQTQLVRGRGDVLERRDMSDLGGMPMLLVNPGIALSTARIFGGWDQVDRGPLVVSDLEGFIAGGRNDLEPSAIAAAPIVAEVLDKLAGCDGVRLTRMSGSGATCFALFDCKDDMAAAARTVRADRAAWWVMATEIRTA